MPDDVRRRWDAHAASREVQGPSNKCNGMTYDAELNLIVCEHVTSSLDARAARRAARGARDALRGQGAEQPERRLRALGRHDLFLRSLVRPHAGVRRRAAARNSASRASTASRPAAARRARGRPPLSTSRTGSASRPTSSCSTSTTPCRRRSASSTSAPTARSRTRASSPAASLRARAGVPDGMKCDERGNIWVTAPGGVWVYSPRASTSARCACPRWSPTSPGAARTGARSSCRDASVYAIPTKVGPRREPYMQRPARQRRHPRSRRPCTAGAAIAAPSGDDCSSIRTLRAHHPGHAERRGHGGRRVRRVRLARQPRAAASSRTSARLAEVAGRAASW